MRIMVIAQMSAIKATIIARMTKFFFFFCLCMSLCGILAPYKSMRARKRAKR